MFMIHSQEIRTPNPTKLCHIVHNISVSYFLGTQTKHTRAWVLYFKLDFSNIDRVARRPENKGLA